MIYQENSILCRGIPVTYSIYGVASTINAAKCLLLKGLKRVQSLNHADAITVFTEQLFVNVLWSRAGDLLAS